MSKRKLTPCCALTGTAFEELAALRKVARAARYVLKECRGSGSRLPLLEKAIENLDDTLWQMDHGQAQPE